MTETASLKKMESKMQDLLIMHNFSIKEAMRQMSRAGERILFVVDDRNRLMGSLTDGDIRKWVLAEGSLAAETSEVCNKNPITLDLDYDIETVKQMMLERKIEGLPVINRKREVREVLLWMEVFGKESVRPFEKIDLPVVIMAGGKGTRLDPFTRILPKPLIPIGEKTILEIIISKFARHGVNDFFLSINHKSRMIKAYFEEIKPPFTLKYIEELEPLGTAGSLRFLESEVEESVIVSNCDIIIESDYHDIVDFHHKKYNDITIVGSFRHFSIPYGVCHITQGGLLTDIQEKPEFDFLVNTGMYILRRHVLSMIPKNTFMNITDLIEKVKQNGGRIGVFPVDEKSWIDVGQWEEYHRATRLLQIKE